MADPAFLSALSGHLAQVRHPDGAVRKQAEAAVKQAEGMPQFTLSLLQLVGQDDRGDRAALGIRLQSAIYFKNHVLRYWDSAADKIKEAERATIRAHIVDLMCSVPEVLRRQISEAVAHISKLDFPDKWGDLLTKLVAKMRTSDFNVINGVLETADSCFAIFDQAEDTDELRYPLRAALDEFADPLLEFARSLDAAVSQNMGNRDQLKTMLLAMRHVASIFLSLSSLDLPDKFEDHLREWMGWWLKYLGLDDGLVGDADEEDPPGVVQRLKSVIVRVVSLYAHKYDEDFEDYFPTFSQAIWAMLVKAGRGRRDTELVTSAMRFVSTLIQATTLNAKTFNKPETLKGIVDQVVVPNLTLTEDDTERFEDEPLEFVRRDYEGGDSSSRRGAACELARAACRAFHPQATQLATASVQQLLAQAASGAWQPKEVAITLLEAIAVKMEVRATGVAELTPGVDVVNFVQTQLVPLLGAPASTPPLLLASALRFVITFRRQMPKEFCASLLAQIGALLSVPTPVIRTYSAILLERLLALREMPEGALVSITRGPARVGKAALQPHLPQLLPLLFRLLSDASDPHNEYLMRAVMRTVSVAKETAAPYIGDVLQHLTVTLDRVCTNPVNPQFNHFLFESLAVLVRNVCAQSASNVGAFEGVLFPPFQRVLSAGVEEITPYVFQIMAQLLELHSDGVPDAYQSLLDPLLTDAVWENRGNIPAVVRLLNAYLRRGRDALVTPPRLERVLLLFRRLMGTKAHTDNAFEIATSVITFMPFESFRAALPSMLQLMLMRLHERMTKRLAKPFVVFVCTLAGLHGAAALIDSLESMQAGLAHMVVSQILAPKMSWVIHPRGRKAIAAGFTRLFTECPQLVTPPMQQALPEVLKGLARVCQGKLDMSSLGGVDDDMVVDNVEYSAGFSRLSFARQAEFDPFSSLTNPAASLAQALAAANTKGGGVIMAAMQTLDKENLGALANMLQAAGVQLA